MSLQWVLEHCETPFGPVPTFNWSVPDSSSTDVADQERSVGQKRTTTALTTPSTTITDADERRLEAAEDQLGSVMWNSNSAALEFLCTDVFAPRTAAAKNTQSTMMMKGSSEDVHLDRDPRTKASGSDNQSPPSTKARRTEIDHSSSMSDSDSSNSGSSNSSRTPPHRRPNAAPTAWQKAATQSHLAGKRILELGAGVGVLGITLARHCSARVAITDIKELVPLMERNIAANFPSSGSNKNSGGGVANSSKQMIKGSSSQASSSAAAAAAAATTETNVTGECHAFVWRWGDTLPADLSAFIVPCDYVILCDALYGNPAEWPKLITNFEEIVRASIATFSSTSPPSSSDKTTSTDTETKKKKKNKQKSHGDEQCSSHHDSSSGTSSSASSVSSLLIPPPRLPIIINFCEQRVANHEDTFMNMLHQRLPRWSIDVTTLPQLSGLDMPIRATVIQPSL